MYIGRLGEYVPLMTPYIPHIVIFVCKPQVEHLGMLVI